MNINIPGFGRISLSDAIGALLIIFAVIVSLITSFDSPSSSKQATTQLTRAEVPTSSPTSETKVASKPVSSVALSTTSPVRSEKTESHHNSSVVPSATITKSPSAAPTSSPKVTSTTYTSPTVSPKATTPSATSSPAAPPSASTSPTPSSPSTTREAAPTSAVFSPVPKVPDNDRIVNQGETLIFSVGDNSYFSCTAGYIDRARLRIYTAGHCAASGTEAFGLTGTNSIFPLGTFVSLGSFTPVGEPQPVLDPEHMENAPFDAGYIKVSPEYATALGSNTIAGNLTLTPLSAFHEEIARRGFALICTYSRMESRNVCGTYFDSIFTPDSITFGRYMGATKGDSGSAVWIESPTKGRVLIGTLIGAYNSAEDNSTETILSLIGQPLGNVYYP